ncbi:DUF5819 family protein [Microbacterium testaceum]|uniref:Uncharacterized protein n=1 Tax=Microbacterium testaceum TaxID=2033 RepID=A0A2T7WSL2_MICTE|nr:DUF5819 family protein [Microbacterium testaceum]PVE77009.1 hypothetical protein DC432_05240 [Microbacterium testaceum]
MTTTAEGAPEAGVSEGRPSARRSGGVMAAVAAAMTLAIVLGYAFVAVSFTIPSSPTRPAVSDAFSPYFSQRWNVFAPNIMKVNRSLQIQVQWREDGELQRSEWVDVTDIEFTSARGIPTPSRISKNSFNAAQAYLTRYQSLSADQRDRVRDTFIRRTNDGAFAPMDPEALLEDLDDLGGSRSALVGYLRYDYMLVRFASAFGGAYFDRDVERVRWRIQHDRPNDFLHRFDEERQSERSYTTFGWRQPAVAPSDEVRAIYDEVIERYTGR